MTRVFSVVVPDDPATPPTITEVTAAPAVAVAPAVPEASEKQVEEPAAAELPAAFAKAASPAGAPDEGAPAEQPPPGFAVTPADETPAVQPPPGFAPVEEAADVAEDTAEGEPDKNPPAGADGTIQEQVRNQ